MMFAQTIVELPKYGARSLEAAISVASVAAPAVNTTTPSRVRPMDAATAGRGGVRGGRHETQRASRRQTMAQSSSSSPPAKARQSARISAASSWAGRSRASARSRSRRSSP